MQNVDEPDMMLFVIGGIILSALFLAIWIFDIPSFVGIDCGSMKVAWVAVDEYDPQVDYCAQFDKYEHGRATSTNQ